jgi:CheY-like chemotaxis protein
MLTGSLQLLLADDDLDDCLFFREALDELPVAIQLVTVHNGVELMQYLTTVKQLPDALFLDLNMPRKNGFECLAEIKHHDDLKALPVIIYSTSFDPSKVQILINNGALQYVRKPGEFSVLKETIARTLTLLISKREDLRQQQVLVSSI